MPTEKELSPPATVAAVASVAQLFHRLNRVLPERQVVIKAAPNMKVGEAIRLMKRGGFSQLPVVEGDEVLGIFSYRSFAEALLRLGKVKGDIANFTVEEFLEKARFARVTDEFDALFDDLDRENVLLVGEPNRLQGIATAMDVLRYLYGVASPFVMIAEIEMAIRALITVAVDSPALCACAAVSLKSTYAEGTVPTILREMTFNDYVQIVGHGDNWIHFEPVFGGMRDTARARLSEVRDLRNDVFHFKREITGDDHARLAEHRDWVLRQARKADARRKGGQS